MVIAIFQHQRIGRVTDNAEAGEELPRTVASGDFLPPVGFGILAIDQKTVAAHDVDAFGILHPVSVVVARIEHRPDFRCYVHHGIDRVTGKLQFVEGVLQQGILHGYGILYPDPLQVPGTLTLNVRMETAAAGQQDQAGQQPPQGGYFKPPIMSSGRTHSSNCSFVSKPSSSAASRSDLFSLCAFLAIFAAFS